MRVNKTKLKIASTAKELFSTHGYDKATMKLLASEAGVNEVTIYRHFGNKDNLLQFITSQYIEEIHIYDKVDSIKDKPIEEVINTISDWFIDYCFENESVYKIQFKMDDNYENFEKLKLTKNFVGAFKDYLLYLQENGKFDGDCDIYSCALITGILGIFTAYALEGNTFRSECVRKVSKVQTEIFIDAIKNK